MSIYETMKEAVLDGDEELALELAEKSLREGLDLQKVLDEGFLAGIQEAGRLYEAEEYFLPDLVCSADAMKSALSILDDAMKAAGTSEKGRGKFAIVTVQGDVHDIGKTIVCAMMTASGYEVYDLGSDVPNETVIEKVKEIEPDVLGLSALLIPTMDEQKNVIDLLTEAGIREKTKVIIGGAPVNKDWADKIGADGYSDNAIAAVKLVDSLLN